MSTKTPTAPLLDAKTSAGLIVHVIRKPPCVRGATMIIMYWWAAWCNTHLQLLRLIATSVKLFCTMWSILYYRINGSCGSTYLILQEKLEKSCWVKIVAKSLNYYFATGFVLLPCITLHVATTAKSFGGYPMILWVWWLSNKECKQFLCLHTK